MAPFTQQRRRLAASVQAVAVTHAVAGSSSSPSVATASAHSQGDSSAVAMSHAVDNSTASASATATGEMLRCPAEGWSVSTSMLVNRMSCGQNKGTALHHGTEYMMHTECMMKPLISQSCHVSAKTPVLRWQHAMSKLLNLRVCCCHGVHRWTRCCCCGQCLHPRQHILHPVRHCDQQQGVLELQACAGIIRASESNPGPCQ